MEGGASVANSPAFTFIDDLYKRKKISKDEYGPKLLYFTYLSKNRTYLTSLSQCFVRQSPTNVFVFNRAAEYKSKYQKLHEVVLKSYASESALLSKVVHAYKL